MNLNCKKWACALHIVTILANIILIVTVISLFLSSHSNERYVALLFLIPPTLSIFLLSCRGDKEERDLRKRIRKAELRKSLKALDAFDRID